MFDDDWLPVDSSKSVQRVQVMNDYHREKYQITYIQKLNKSLGPGNSARSDLHSYSSNTHETVKNIKI